MLRNDPCTGQHRWIEGRWSALAFHVAEHLGEDAGRRRSECCRVKCMTVSKQMDRFLSSVSIDISIPSNARTDNDRVDGLGKSSHHLPA